MRDPEKARAYEQSEKGRARRARYKQSEKGRANDARYDQSEKGKARKRKYEELHGSYRFLSRIR